MKLQVYSSFLIHVAGPVDEHGYIEAEHEGRLGLVPAVYLTETNTHPHAESRRKLPTIPHGEDTNNPTMINGSPEQILLMHEEIAASHTPQHGTRFYIVLMELLILPNVQ